MKPLLPAFTSLFLSSTPGLLVAEEKSGEEVYQSYCIACHGSGELNAPRLGDKKRWTSLLREGLNELVPASYNGIRKMPAKGGNPALSDMETARAVIYMANAGGGRFAEPTAAEVSRWRGIADRRKKK